MDSSEGEEMNSKQLPFKEIHVGSLIRKKVEEKEIELERVCNFFRFTENEVIKMFECSSLDTECLLKWSKLLEYDFFRIYCQHLILYSPVSASEKKAKSSLPIFRKNIYTQELIDFVLELIETRKKDKFEVMSDYNIPKTTLYKWLSKYKKVMNNG